MIASSILMGRAPAPIEQVVWPAGPWFSAPRTAGRAFRAAVAPPPQMAPARRCRIRRPARGQQPHRGAARGRGRRCGVSFDLAPDRRLG